MLKCVKITSFFFVLLFALLPDTTSTVSGDCDVLRSCVNYKYREKKKKKKGRDQNGYKFTYVGTYLRYQLKTMAYTQISQNKIHFLL